MSTIPFKETDKGILLSGLMQKSNGSSRDQIIGLVILTNIGFLLIRPQVIAPFLAEAKITVTLWLICFIFWFLRPGRIKQPEFLAIGLLLTIHAAMIFIGRFLWEDLVVNTGAAASVWFDVIQYLFCFLFPLFTYLTFTKQFRRLNGLFIIAGAYIGLYAITHSGVGPGGFLQDENDCGMMLAFLLPFALFSFSNSKTVWRKILVLVAISIMFAGIVSTNSRGTFVGVICTLAFVFIYSKQKITLIFLALVGVSATIPFLPADYFNEIQSISHTDEGTAKTRFEYWGTALKAWADPKFTLQGVGFDNIPWRLHQYQGAEFGLTKSGLGGRQVHSLFVQIIADLGLLGIIILGYCAYRAIIGNFRCRKELLKTEAAIARLKKSYTKLNKIPNIEINNNSPVGENDKFLKQLLRIQTDIEFLLAFFNCLTGAWIAMATAGAFISVLYYPTPWLILTITVAAQLHWRETKRYLYKALKMSQELVTG